MYYLIAAALIALHIILVLWSIKWVLETVNPRYRMTFALYTVLHLITLVIAVVALLRT